MILENFKSSSTKDFPFLRWSLAIVFLSAGIFRIIFPSAGVTELSALGLPLFLRWPLMLFEILSGLALIFRRLLRPMLIMLAAFIFFALLWALLVAGKGLWLLSGELFIFNLTPTDWFLHAIFLATIVFLLKNYQTK